MNDSGNQFNHDSIVKLWEGNADSWVELSRLGYDICRDHLNMPQFMKMLPCVQDKFGLDIGCGEGTNTRTVARAGAKLVGVDPSSKFIEHAKSSPENEGLSLQFQVASANQLPFDEQTFDFAISTMVFMDILDLESAFEEAYRVLKPGGFLQFSIVHPCFSTPKQRWIEDQSGKVEGVLVGDYFKEGPTLEEWSFSSVEERIKGKHDDFKVVHIHRTLSTWLNFLIRTGFIVEKLLEPYPTDEVVAKHPNLAKLQEVPWFLHIQGTRR